MSIASFADNSEVNDVVVVYGTNAEDIAVFLSVILSNGNNVLVI